MTAYTIREFSMNDYDTVYCIWQATPGMGLSSVDSRENIERFLTANPNLSFVAEADGRIIGTVLCGNDSRRGFLYDLTVLPEFRKQGIATELIKRCLNGLKAICIAKCHLFVLTDNSSAMEYYRKIGWQERFDIQVFSSDIK